MGGVNSRIFGEGGGGSVFHGGSVRCIYIQKDDGDSRVLQWGDVGVGFLEG